MQESPDYVEDEREKIVESALNKVLDNIENNFKRVLDLVPKNCPNHSDDEENLQDNAASIISDFKGKYRAECEHGEPSKEQVNMDKANIANETYEDSDIFIREFEKYKQSK